MSEDIERLRELIKKRNALDCEIKRIKNETMESGIAKVERTGGENYNFWRLSVVGFKNENRTMSKGLFMSDNLDDVSSYINDLISDLIKVNEKILERGKE